MFLFVPVLLVVPCCPRNVSVSEISWESLMIMWTAVRGADLYEVQAVDSSNQTVVCNDTSAVCVLSDLNCNTWYNVFVSPCNEVRGCNRSCRPQKTETGKIKKNTQFRLHSSFFFLIKYPFNTLSQLPVCLME